jgi:hypothetical protein
MVSNQEVEVYLAAETSRSKVNAKDKKRKHLPCTLSFRRRRTQLDEAEQSMNQVRFKSRHLFSIPVAYGKSHIMSFVLDRHGLLSVCTSNLSLPNLAYACIPVEFLRHIWVVEGR